LGKCALCPSPPSLFLPVRPPPAGRPASPRLPPHPAHTPKMLACTFFTALLSLPLLVSSTPPIPTSPGVFDVTSYGGVGDGTTLNTKAFQSAVAAAHTYYITTGYTGTVLVPSPGTFFSGQIILLGGVTLSITTGATLLASPSASDYPTDQSKWAFLYSNAVTNIEVSGGGQVDGNYQHYIGGWVEANDEFIPTGWAGCSGECRPRLAMFVDSVGVVVHDVTFKGSPDWTFHLLNCTYVHVYNWTQRGDERWPNNDGIDLDSCNHVLVEDSDIDTADDGVCLKGSALNGTSINVTVRNTRIRSRSSAVKFGSNCPILFQNHIYENLYIHDSNRGLALQVRDGGWSRTLPSATSPSMAPASGPFTGGGMGGPCTFPPC
jgi:polygalacturonase